MEGIGFSAWLDNDESYSNFSFFLYHLYLWVLVLRVLGKDLLDEKIDRNGSTYWRKQDASSDESQNTGSNIRGIQMSNLYMLKEIWGFLSVRRKHHNIL